MDVLLFALWCFTVAFAGGLVGLVLGNLRLPATLLVASSAGAGTGANLLVSAAAAGAASWAHIRAGRVNWRLFAWMAPPSIAFAVVGGYVSGVLPRTPLLLFIAAVLIVSGLQLLGWQPIPRTEHDTLDLRAAVLSGAFIGFLGGVVGLILGSLRMPALLRIVGEPPASAAGVNVAVGFWVGIAGAIGHLPSTAPDWRVAGVGAAASIPGALLGARLTGRLTERQLVRAIAVVVMVAGMATAVEAVA
ncbi:MAG: putative sulfonate transporter [Solirubrobacterales bacterium]|nr:putative sulfonate transporter [Solirubrobacterales bacterium]